MYRNFVSAEFTWTTRQSWITQFENALKLIKDISDLKMTVDSRDTKPEEKICATAAAAAAANGDDVVMEDADADAQATRIQALVRGHLKRKELAAKEAANAATTAAIKDYTSKLLNILVDENEYRWVNIINLIPFNDIGKISSVIEFLGDIDTEIANKCGGCRQTRISTINRVIDMIKRISLPKRIKNNDLLINQKKELLRVIRRNWSNSIDRRLGKAEERWFDELFKEGWYEVNFLEARIKQWETYPKNRDKMEETAEEINEYKNILVSKSFSQMNNEAVDMEQIKEAREQIKEARKQYRLEFQDSKDLGEKQQKYYDLIVKKLPCLGVLSKQQKKYYDIIVEKSVLNKEKKKLITEISLLNHFKRLLEFESFESENQKRYSQKYKLRVDQTK